MYHLRPILFKYFLAAGRMDLFPLLTERQNQSDLSAGFPSVENFN
jgi:hypothetical protein